LPNAYGIGAFSHQAYEFVDFLERSGQRLWQILPLGPTGYGDSPYQSFSTFAGNPYYIDLEALAAEGFLTQEECEAAAGALSPDVPDTLTVGSPIPNRDSSLAEKTVVDDTIKSDTFEIASDSTVHAYVDYAAIYFTRFPILKRAYIRWKERGLNQDQDYLDFVQGNNFWLEDYCLYMAVKNHFGGISWAEWEGGIRNREAESLKAYSELLAGETGFYAFMQYVFHTQWQALKRYANQKGIDIIGDIPIYVAFDSADTWANPGLFQLDEERSPIRVAGCPPDAFSATGQLWGNPLYDWQYHRETGYAWWIRRISYCFNWYDIVRIDHFRGFDSYWAIPFGDETAAGGRWEKGPGYDIFAAIKGALGKVNLIAEDLGFLTPSVLRLLKKTGYPGMKVLQFAFDSREENDYLPHNYVRNCVVYTGTHDNDTLRGWFPILRAGDRKFARKYLNLKSTKDMEWAFIRAALSSVADTAVIPMQDYLGLGSEGRINTPSTLGGNWEWRMTDGALTDGLAQRIREMTKLYGRVNSK
jgi:4-alpha-glucanotransferase